MDNKQRELVNRIIDRELRIFALEGVANRLVNKYGESELDEQMMDDIRDEVNNRIAQFSNDQWKSICDYDGYYPNE